MINVARSSEAHRAPVDRREVAGSNPAARLFHQVNAGE